MSTLAQLIDRVQAALADDGTVFTDADCTEALRTALHEYSQASPQHRETVITAPAAGREIALDSLAGLLAVTAVWWPYDSAGAAEAWPPNRVTRISIYWDDARPVLLLGSDDGAQPQAADELRIWYTIPHAIQDLDDGAATTVPAPDESLLVLGATGFALLSRSAALAESTTSGAVATPNYAASGFRYLRQFRIELNQRRHDAAASRGEPWAGGWMLDRWESVRAG